MKKEKGKNKGITLIALIITVIVLLILAGVILNLSLGNHGLFSQSQNSAQIYNKEEATQTLHMKITSLQMKKYVDQQQLPNLQELADGLCEDEEMEYVQLESRATASLNKIVVGENKSIFTKIKKYPYEFEINEQLQLASIDGVEITDSKPSSHPNVQLGDTILYKNNTFKVKRIIGNAVTMVCIPDNNTPTIKFGDWKIIENCENFLNSACQNFFVDENLGIKSEDVYNARKTDFQNGWLEIPTAEGAEFWLASGYLVDSGKANIYLHYFQRNVGLSGKLIHSWGPTKPYSYTLAVCPIITFSSNLLKVNSEHQLCLE